MATMGATETAPVHQKVSYYELFEGVMQLQQQEALIKKVDSRGEQAQIVEEARSALAKVRSIKQHNDKASSLHRIGSKKETERLTNLVKTLHTFACNDEELKHIYSPAARRRFTTFKAPPPLTEAEKDERLKRGRKLLAEQDAILASSTPEQKAKRARASLEEEKEQQRERQSYLQS